VTCKGIVASKPAVIIMSSHPQCLVCNVSGTHLYVLYEGYGFSVANLYCLGFVTGALASPITGPLVDKLGRKKSAILYCLLEITINRMEQYPVLWGLIISRMVGGITTNLLSTVFDTWLDTEYRRRGIRREGGYEIIMRDSVIVSNLAAIGSGYLAHVLAEMYGLKGPFEGAVVCTSIALVVIMFIWTENFGCGDDQIKGMKEYMNDAVTAFKSDNRALRLGIIQGLTCASIQIFIFLWSPALRHFAVSAPKNAIGLDRNGEPAYGLIFGAFMAAGVLGGLTAPAIRRVATSMMKSAADDTTTANLVSQLGRDGEHTYDDRPMAVEALSTVCYLASAFLLLLPCLLDGEGENSFSICLVAFLIYEYIVGLYLPCEGVLRSIYFPAEGRASILTLPRIIVNCSVSVGVILTNHMT
jgi:MFS transporter, MFS domain-containing protein family, molybdate-anion transporter